MDGRTTPEKILRQIRYDDKNKNRGRLKIFFGYAAGVGKTYAMLKAAHEMKEQGVDVVAGYIEPHTRPETTALIDGLEMLPAINIKHNEITLKEFDLDGAIKRRPQLILVDELAHSNSDGCRHLKRYQDIEELLNNGIDVYTTVNVQHIESLNDIVASITGINVRERIPDKIFDSAQQVQLVDIEPENLLERLNKGKIYKSEQAARAAANFFTIDNLISLREIALRRTADRVNKISERKREKYVGEHILVCLSSSPSNSKIIRNAARLANAFNAQFTALFVETPGSMQMREDNRTRLRNNLKLAQQLGASIETVYGEDIVFQIAEFARLSGITKIVIGRTTTKKTFLSGKTFADRLTELAPNIDIYIIPDNNSEVYKRLHKIQPSKFSVKDVIISLVILILATLINVVFQSIGFSNANIIMIYILGVLITAVLTVDMKYSVITSILSVLMFNFFFTMPTYTFQAYGPEYPVTFVVMFLVAFIVGSLTTRIKNQAKQSAEFAYRTKILLETNQFLQQTKSYNEIIDVTSKQLLKLTGKTVVAYIKLDGKLSKPKVYMSGEDTADKNIYTSSNEKAVAQWVYNNNKRAGAGTNTLDGAKCLYMAVRSQSEVYGVIGISAVMDEIGAFENSLVLSVIGECAAAYEKKMLAKKREDALLQADHEKLRANLLRAISHDLRTPLTSISGNAGVLINNGKGIDEKKKNELCQDIYDDSMWLINLVENLLSVTRIEDKRMGIVMEGEIVEEVISEALRHISRDSKKHKIKIKPNDDIILAKMDSRLITQVIINIVNNAIKYTPDGSEITISTYIKGDNAVVDIADNGDGIEDSEKEKLFDMFYTGRIASADGRRGMGLGLSLCKSIINAHGGEINVYDNIPHGAVFRFTLKVMEVNCNE